jgi:hypothetical protein
MAIITIKKCKKIKLFFLTGRADQQGYETSRLPQFLYNQLADGGEIVSLMF